MDTCACTCPCTHGHMCMQTYIPQRKVCALQRLLLFDLFLSSPSGSPTVTLWQAPYSHTKRFANSIFIDFQSLWIVALDSLNALGFEHQIRFVVLSIPRCSRNPKARWLTDHPLCRLPDLDCFSLLLSLVLSKDAHLLYCAFLPFRNSRTCFLSAAESFSVISYVFWLLNSLLLSSWTR